MDDDDEHHTHDGLEQHREQRCTVLVGVCEHLGHVALVTHEVQGPGGSQERGLDEHDHSRHQQDECDDQSDGTEVVFGDGVEGGYAPGIDLLRGHHSVHDEGYDEVHGKADETCGDECLGDVLSGLLVLCTVGCCGFPCTCTPLGVCEHTEHHQEVIHSPFPTVGGQVVDDVADAESGEFAAADGESDEGQHDDDEKGQDGDQRKDETEGRSSGKTLGSDIDDSSEDDDTEQDLQCQNGGFVGERDSQTVVEEFTDIINGGTCEDRDDGGPREPIRPRCERSYELTQSVPSAVGLGENFLGTASDTRGFQGRGHFADGQVLGESLKNGYGPDHDTEGPCGTRDIIDTREDQDGHTHRDDHTLFPVD